MMNILIDVFALIFSRKKIKIHELLLFGGTTFMTLKSMRHFMLLIIMSTVLLPHIEDAYDRLCNSKINPARILSLGKVRICIILCVIYVLTVTSLFLVKSYSPDAQIPSSAYPILATEYIKSNLHDARIFNEYNWGSYLMFHDIPVFIDSRCDLYTDSYNKGVDVLRDYTAVQAQPTEYNYIIDKYDIQYFLLYNNSKLGNYILKEKAGKIIYQDKISVIIEITTKKLAKVTYN